MPEKREKDNNTKLIYLFLNKIYQSTCCVLSYLPNRKYKKRNDFHYLTS
jgi:hypothetical protein